MYLISTYIHKNNRGGGDKSIISVKSTTAHSDFTFCVILFIRKYENVFVMASCYCLGTRYIRILKPDCKFFFHYTSSDIYIDRSLSFILKKIKEHEKFTDLHEHCSDFTVVVKIMALLHTLHFLFN